MNRLSHYVSLFRFAFVVAGAIVLIGCDGTEGGNPNRLDGGPMGGSCVPVGDAGPGGGDGGASVPPVPSCDPDATGDDACGCAAGAARTLATADRRILDVSLHGPTPSGGFVAVVAQPCFGGLCPPETVDLPIRVHRFGGDGAPIGTPIEVPAHLYGRPHAALDGSALALAWTNVGGLDVPGDTRFAVLDVASGGWALEPRTIGVDRPSMATPVAVSRRADGWATVWTGFRPDGIADIGFSYLVPIGVDGMVGASVQLPTELPHVAPHPTGHALVFAHEGTVLFRTLATDGTLSDPVTVGEGYGAIAIAERAGGGYLAAFSTPAGSQIVDLDVAGAPAGTPRQIGPTGLVRAVTVASDGSTWVLWQQSLGCRDGRTSTELLLAHFAADGTRLGTDIAFSRESSSADAVGLVLSGGGPIVASATFDPTSRVVMRSLCAPD